MNKGLKIFEDSKNYTAQVIKLPVMQKVPGLDRLVKVNVQGNDCLIGADSDPNILYLFFPAECEISQEFLSANNLYRHNELNADKLQKGFFEDNRRVKAIKFKGIISSGFVIPMNSLENMSQYISLNLEAGDEFNELNGVKICQKYLKRTRNKGANFGPKSIRIIDQIVDSCMAPQHFDTQHLMKNTHKLALNDQIVVSIKLHGTSARYFNTLVKRKLSLVDRLSKFFGAKVQTETYDYVTGSRQVLKSLGFESFPHKNHFYQEDLWSKLGKEHFEGKLNHGEAVYCEIVGKTPTGEAIQHGYTYGLEGPKLFIYRISNINAQGIEIDLPYAQMKERAVQLGIDICPEFFVGSVQQFLSKYHMADKFKSDQRELESNINHVFYDVLLEKPSVLDSSIIEEGFCVRVDKYPKPEIFKIKSKAFLLHEGVIHDKEIKDVEEEQTLLDVTNGEV